MTSEALQNPYFVRLYCKNIDKTHSLTEPNDKIQFHGNYFFKKKGGGNHFGKGGGGEPTPLFAQFPSIENWFVRNISFREGKSQFRETFMISMCQNWVGFIRFSAGI